MLKGLRLEFQETTVLALHNGIFSQYIFVEHFDDILGRHVETGSVRPLISSATGWCLLSNISDYEIGKIIRRTKSEITTQNKELSNEYIMDKIDEVRALGYSMSSGETANNAAGLTFALPAAFSV